MLSGKGGFTLPLILFHAFLKKMRFGALFWLFLGSSYGLSTQGPETTTTEATTTTEEDQGSGKVYLVFLNPLTNLIVQLFEWWTGCAGAGNSNCTALCGRTYMWHLSYLYKYYLLESASNMYVTSQYVPKQSLGFTSPIVSNRKDCSVFWFLSIHAEGMLKEYFSLCFFLNEA